MVTDEFNWCGRKLDTPAEYMITDPILANYVLLDLIKCVLVLTGVCIIIIIYF